MGFAFHFSHAGHVAEVVELSIDDDKKISIHKVTAAIDIGPVINMSGALKQIEGAATDALSSIMDLEITMRNGEIQQENFHQYNIVRMRTAPLNIEAHFIQSEYDPTGLGEPALPPLMPAVTNAIFAANGERIKTLPLSKSGYTLA
jgi:isoquinoline 1-oxidoreductase beta subunit